MRPYAGINLSLQLHFILTSQVKTNLMLVTRLIQSYHRSSLDHLQFNTLRKQPLLFIESLLSFRGSIFTELNLLEGGHECSSVVHEVAVIVDWIRCCP